MAMSIFNNMKAQAPDDVGLTNNAQQDWPWWWKAWSSLPPWQASMGASAFRGGRTIVTGGWSSASVPMREGIHPGDMFRRQMTKLNPRTLGQYSSQDWIDPGKKHNIFQAAGMVNYPLQTLATGEANIGPFKAQLPKFTEPIGRWMLDKGMAPDAISGRVLSPGLLMTNSAANRLGRMSELTDKTVFNTASYIERSDPMLAERLKFSGPSFAVDSEGVATGAPQAERTVAEGIRAKGMTPEDLSQIVGTSGGGPLNRAIGGYLRGASGQLTDAAVEHMAPEAMDWAAKGAYHNIIHGFLPGETAGFKGIVASMRAPVADNIAEAAGKFGAEKFASTAGEKVVGDALLQASERAGATLASDIATHAVVNVAEHAAVDVGVGLTERLTARAGLMAAGIFTGPAAPFIEAGLWLWTAYDVGKTVLGLGADAGKAAANFAKEGSKSFQGDINKAPMSGWRGLGYMDSEAAATSRRRGVQAIQNSRLNARSVLGSEAPMLHAHFG